MGGNRTFAARASWIGNLKKADVQGGAIQFLDVQTQHWPLSLVDQKSSRIA
jgi:hypothetical protein